MVRRWGTSAVLVALALSLSSLSAAQGSTSPSAVGPQVSALPTQALAGGKLVSRRPLPAGMYASEHLAGEYFGHLGRGSNGKSANVRVWNAATGKLWSARMNCPKNGARSDLSSLRVGTKRVYALMVCTITDPDGLTPPRSHTLVHAYHLTTGRLLWKQSTEDQELRVLADANEQWLAISAPWNGGWGAPDLSMPIRVIDATTGEWGQELSGNAGVHLAMSGDVLVVNAPVSNPFGWDMRTGEILWRHDSLLSNVDIAVGGRVLLSASGGAVVLDSLTGATVAENVPYVMTFDKYSNMASTKQTLIDTTTWRTLWQLYDADITAICAGRVWDSLGRVHIASDGKVIARRALYPPVACLSDSRAAFEVKGKRGMAVEIYSYPRN